MQSVHLNSNYRFKIKKIVCLYQKPHPITLVPPPRRHGAVRVRAAVGAAGRVRARAAARVPRAVPAPRRARPRARPATQPSVSATHNHHRKELLQGDYSQV